MATAAAVMAAPIAATVVVAVLDAASTTHVSEVAVEVALLLLMLARHTLLSIWCAKPLGTARRTSSPPLARHVPLSRSRFWTRGSLATFPC